MVFMIIEKYFSITVTATVTRKWQIVCIALDSRKYSAVALIALMACSIYLSPLQRTNGQDIAFLGLPIITHGLLSIFCTAWSQAGVMTVYQE